MGHDRHDRPTRLAHVVSHPIHYFAPLYRELSTRPELDLTVYYNSDVSLGEHSDPGFGRAVEWDSDLIGGFQHRILGSARGRPLRAGIMNLPQGDVLRELMERPYDAVWLHGYNHASSVAAAALFRARGRKVLIRDEQTLIERRVWHKTVGKETGLRLLLSQVTALYIGEANRRYYEHLGVPRDRLVRAPYCVDNDSFCAKAAELRTARDSLRASLGITDDAPVILFVGKLVPRKAPAVLLEAFRTLRAIHPAWLLFAGDGEMRAELEARVRDCAVPGVKFLGFVNQSDVSRAYAASDVFTLPSVYNETWGLVTNEAMNFGLPVVTSDHVGSSLDLVRHGWNGYVTRAGDPHELAQALSALVSDAHRRKQFGANSLRLIADYSIQACADGIVSAAVA